MPAELEAFFEDLGYAARGVFTGNPAPEVRDLVAHRVWQARVGQWLHPLVGAAALVSCGFAFDSSASFEAVQWIPFVLVLVLGVTSVAMGVLHRKQLRLGRTALHWLDERSDSRSSRADAPV